MIAGLTSLGLAGDYVYFGVMRHSLGVKSVLLIAPVAAITGGLAGGLFSRLVQGFAASPQIWLVRLRARPVLLAAGCGMAVAVVGLASSGATWGTGYQATQQLVEMHGQPLWFGPAKFFATLATTLSGTPGGIFAPSRAKYFSRIAFTVIAMPKSPSEPG